MKLKKFNAALSLFTIIVLLAHIGIAFRALDGWEHILTDIVPNITMVLVVIHGIISMCVLLFIHDGNDMKYPISNIHTIIQRLSGILLLVPLLMSHNKVYSEALEPAFLYAGLEILFFLLAFTHIATSFPRALITLGALKSEKKFKTVSIIAAVICVILFVDALLMVLRTIL